MYGRKGRRKVRGKARANNIHDEQPTLPWVVGSSAVLLNRCEVPRDGPTMHRPSSRVHIVGMGG